VLQLPPERLVEEADGDVAAVEAEGVLLLRQGKAGLARHSQERHKGNADASMWVFATSTATSSSLNTT
jgi:hypothetical protein